MKQVNPAKGLTNILNVLDMLMEMLDNSARAYQKMALDAKPNGTKALLNWFYYIETIRLRRLTSRRQTLLKRHPELKGNGYRARAESGLSKIGQVNGLLLRAAPLDIMRYAIDNEVRAMQFFRRKAVHTKDPVQRMMYSAAIKEQESHIAMLSAKRQDMMQRQIDRGAEEMDGILV